jgi:predicted transcriptional regulator
MSGIAQLNERIAALEAATEQCRAETRASHEATKELRRVKKEIRDMLDKEVRDIVNAAIGEHVERRLADFDTTLTEAMHEGVLAVGREFDKLAKLYIGVGDDNIHDIAMRRKEILTGAPEVEVRRS